MKAMQPGVLRLIHKYPNCYASNIWEALGQERKLTLLNPTVVNTLKKTVNSKTVVFYTLPNALNGIEQVTNQANPSESISPYLLTVKHYSLLSTV